jgi:hypothetical protein
MAAQLLLSQPIGAAFLQANAGLGLHDEPLRPHQQRDFLVYGVAITGAPDRRWEPVLEVAGRAGKGSPGAEARSEARLGLRCHTGRAGWSVALRRGLAEADGTWGLAAGLTLAVRQGR